MKQNWAKSALRRGNFLLFELYLDDGKYGKEYQAFQEANVFRSTAPHYMIINASGELVVDENDITHFGVQTSMSKEDMVKTFQAFLDKKDEVGLPIADW